MRMGGKRMPKQGEKKRNKVTKSAIISWKMFLHIYSFSASFLVLFSKCPTYDLKVPL